MALASLALAKNSLNVSPRSEGGSESRIYLSKGKSIGFSKGDTIYIQDINMLTPTPTRRAHYYADLARIEAQSRRPMSEGHTGLTAHTGVDTWILMAIDSLVLFCFSIVVTSFFILLLELSAGRPAFLLPSFSAFLIFSIIALVAFKLGKAAKRARNGSIIY